MRKMNQNGSFIIMLTLSFALMGTFIGFAVDFGRAYLQRARVNRLVDGASLAAAKALKGQAGLINDATLAACDSMKLNGAPVEMIGANQCKSTKGAPFTVTLDFVDVAVAGGPPMKHVQVTGEEPVSTTFLRFLGWMVPGDYSTINVAATAQAAPERPVDLMLVLDRSGSMSTNNKIGDLKKTVNEFLDNNFTGNDRIGMVSFAWRGCGNAFGGDDFAANICQPDVAMMDATSSNITTLKNQVNGLDAGGATNTMEALRTARVPIAAAFNDPTRATTRKVVLLITDGKPTAMRRDNDTQCKRDPKTGAVVTAWDNGSFPNGCLMEATSQLGSFASRRTLSLGPPTNANGSSYFLNTISCFRSLHDCDAGTNGAMYEADLIRNCGYNNSGCAAGGDHDVLVFAIGIGTLHKDANQSFDKHAKCMLLRIANGTDLVNTGDNTIETIDTTCTPPPPSYPDGDTYAELRNSWPCGAGPCIDTTQEKGKVYFVDQTGNVEAQMQQVFRDIAAILKLRLTI